MSDMHQPEERSPDHHESGRAPQIPVSDLSPLDQLQQPDADLKSDLEPVTKIETGWDDLVDVARHCPSPHNVQPWRISPTGTDTADLLINGERTFPWTDHTGSFILSSMKMFTTCLQITAQNKGMNLEVDVQDVNEIEMQAPLSLFAKLKMTPDPDLPPHQYSDADLMRRKTSRKPNIERPVPQEVLEEVREIVSSHGFQLLSTDDQSVIDRTLRQDIKALFHDLNFKEYFQELKPWLQLGSQQESPEGLHYKAMELPRWQFALMKHFPAALTLPIVKNITSGIYRRELGHCQEMGFISGDFWGREDSLKAGEMLINTWMALSRHDIHIHPFGNLVTNTDARAKVESDLGIEKLWFVFRMGYTDTPEKSQRLSVQKLILPD